MSQQCVVPGVHRSEGLKVCPNCREDLLPLSHKQEVEAESDQLSVASPPSFLFFSLEELCKCFLPLLQFRSQKGDLEPAKEALTALSLQDLRFGARILNSFQFYCLNMQNWEFPVCLLGEAQARQTCQAC